MSRPNPSLSLTLPTLTTLPPSMEKFQVPDLFFIRHAKYYDSKGNTRTMMVVITGRNVYICTIEGAMERSIPLPLLLSATTCAFVKRSLFGATNERQVLLKINGEHDLLVGFHTEPKNGPNFQDSTDFDKVLAEVARVLKNTEWVCEDKSSSVDPKEGIFNLAVFTIPTTYVDSKQRLLNQRALITNAAAYPELLTANAMHKKVLADETRRIADLQAVVDSMQGENADSAVKALVEKVSGMKNTLGACKKNLNKLEKEIATLQTSCLKKQRELDVEVGQKKELLQKVYDAEGAERFTKHEADLVLRKTAHKKNKDKLLARIAEAEGKLSVPRHEAEAAYISLLVKVGKERDARMLEEKFRDAFERDLEGVTKATILARSQLEESLTVTAAPPAPPVVVSPPKAAAPAVSLFDDDVVLPVKAAAPPKVSLFDDDDLLGGGGAAKPAPPKAAISLFDDDDLPAPTKPMPPKKPIIDL